MNMISIKPIELVVVILLMLSSHMASPLHVLPGEETQLSPEGGSKSVPPPGRSLIQSVRKKAQVTRKPTCALFSWALALAVHPRRKCNGDYYQSLIKGAYILTSARLRSSSRMLHP